MEPIARNLNRVLLRTVSSTARGNNIGTSQLGGDSGTIPNGASRAQVADHLRVFKENGTKWWTGDEFSLLREMNKLRVPFVVDGLDKPLDQCRLLDVGCGGGILSEPLARLGGNVLGIDPVFESINAAHLHASADESLKDRLKYRNCNIEDLSATPEHMGAYDAIVASEVLEHIEDIESFLAHCHKILRTYGSLMITTINQTPLSWLGVIYFGETVLKQLPKGTHNYNMFVSVKGLRIMLERLGFHIKLVNGFMYEPFGKRFYWTPTTMTHYAMHAVKLPVSTGGSGGSPKININHEQRRHASGKSRKNAKLPSPKCRLDRDEMMMVIPYDSYQSKADAIMSELKDHLNRDLSPQSSLQSLEQIKINVDGHEEQLELRDIAQISTKGSNLLMINLSAMPEAIKATVYELEQMGHGNIQVEVNNIFVSVPRVTRELRERLVSTAKQSATKAKAKLKSLYSEFCSLADSKTIMNESGVSKDLVRSAKENLLYDVQKRTQDIENLFQTKSDQLLNQKS